MKCDISLKNIEIDYSIYSHPMRLGCPSCKYRVNHKTKTYHSMKSLLYHLSREHAHETNSPFTVNEVKILLQAIAKSKELGLLHA